MTGGHRAVGERGDEVGSAGWALGLATRWRAELQHELNAATVLRHRLHADPRVSGDESATCELVLRALGAGTASPMAGTGARVAFSGSPAALGAQPAVALRTELDALPIAERSGVGWASQCDVMHACGHDLHMAALVAVCRSAARVVLPAPLVALLQPREEGADSGARDAIAEGALRGIGEVVAAHVQPQLAAGVIGVTAGTVNAGTTDFEVEVQGQGGHSGYPHTVTDSVLALSSVVVALQQISARRIDPVRGAACMVNQLRAGSANNVVPATATASGTVRAMTGEDQQRAQAAIVQIAHHVAASHGCQATVTFDEGDPPLVNDSALAAGAGEILEGLGRATSGEFRSFGSDDFAHYCGPVRGLMTFVGTGDRSGGLHDPTYVPDDSYVAAVADALIAGYCAAVATRGD